MNVERRSILVIREGPVRSRKDVRVDDAVVVQVDAAAQAVPAAEVHHLAPVDASSIQNRPTCHAEFIFSICRLN